MELTLNRNLVSYFGDCEPYRPSKILFKLSRIFKINYRQDTHITVTTDDGVFECLETFEGSLGYLLERFVQAQELMCIKTKEVKITYQRFGGYNSGKVLLIKHNCAFENKESYKDAVYFCLKRAHLEHILELTKVNIEEIKELDLI